MASLTSPFQRVPGTFKFGDYTYEWRSLLNTPCYGFNGPNACYSSTCKHDGSKSAQQQPKMLHNIVKHKSSSSSMSKFSVKFNVRAVPDSASDSDGSSISSGSSSGDGHMVNGIPIHVSSKLNSERSTSADGGRWNFDEKSIKGQSIQQFFTVSPTIEVNVHVESPSAAYYSSSLSSSSTSGYISSGSSSNGDKISNSNNNKNHAFNPLSKPFHPMKKKDHAVTSRSDAAVSSKIYDSIATATTVDDDAFLKIICQPKQYVCILCAKTFATATELQRHIENKTQQPHDCVICSQTFTHAYQLQRHLWLHLKNHRRIRSFNCRACQKKFRSLKQLHKHYELCQYKLYIFF